MKTNNTNIIQIIRLYRLAVIEGLMTLATAEVLIAAEILDYNTTLNQ